ncbi:MAG: MBL fold metallo-hydrolase, partial [Desulfobacteraceae bacterium]
TVGDYSLKCIETPGHTRGHICLYEPDRKILIAGDHVLVDITPNITSWSDEGNPLKQYMSSLDKVYELDVDLVLPGHRRVFRNHRERIEQLKHHHQERLDEVVSILENGQRTAYQVASQMSWDMTYDSWDVFPLPQKWFALGEALSHLRYLEEEGQVQNQARDGVVVYWLT